MKILITDLMEDCCPVNIEMGACDEELARRITESVLGKLGVKHRKLQKAGRLSRTILLAAVIAVTLATACFALAEYTMSRRKPEESEELLSGFRYEEVVDGKVWNSQILAYPDAGMVFTFHCPETTVSEAEFRCFWLPEEATEGTTDVQGWTDRLFCEKGDEILYCIYTVDHLRDGMQRLLNGKAEAVKEEQKGEWQLLEVTSDYSELMPRAYDRANYILLFHRSTGALIVIAGQAEMETLERIAEQMEIREHESSEPAPAGGEIGILDLGRG